MAIHHALSGELIDVRPLGDELANTTTRTLYKTEHLEVFRVILRAGKAMPAHRVAGEITVQCLEGCIEFTTDKMQRMHGGDLICLAGGELHALKAIDDSSAIVTVLLHGA
ncbi:cupin [Variovorax humicola]|uniref:Cupin n=1 Tax=Variovorax humicola TaxID=1769758 RepID=A0ABU8W952_9BURK